MRYLIFLLPIFVIYGQDKSAPDPITDAMRLEIANMQIDLLSIDQQAAAKKKEIIDGLNKKFEYFAQLCDSNEAHFDQQAAGKRDYRCAPGKDIKMAQASPSHTQISPSDSSEVYKKEQAKKKKEAEDKKKKEDEKK